MSDSWDFVPEWKADGDRKGIVGEIQTTDGYEKSAVTLERARELEAMLRQLGTTIEADGPAVLGWALQWMADDMRDAIDACDGVVPEHAKHGRAAS